MTMHQDLLALHSTGNKEHTHYTQCASASSVCGSSNCSVRVACKQRPLYIDVLDYNDLLHFV